MQTWTKGIIIQKNRITPDFIVIRCRLPKKQRFKSGQYYDIRIPGTSEFRSYSIMSPESYTNEVEFGIKVIKKGLISPLIMKMNIGETLELRGPAGTHFIISHTHPLILLAGGSGITPFLSLLRTLSNKKDKQEIVLFYSSYNEKTLYFNEEISSMDVSKIRTFLYLTRTGHKSSRITSVEIKKNLNKLTNYLVYISGSDAFVNSMNEVVSKLKVPYRSIKIENFGFED